ncbi:CNDP dipeptidase [Pluteus cervinus]|uniref:CNDP dipeptidase n=1 Tax=Pluteus cervinus TaxID=181527 RepID=A0ACD3BD75_9AGAR|nr:CNDP dipeptidase [Pluteus cervinus]
MTSRVATAISIPFTEWVDANAERFIERLKEAVAIPSISGDSARRDDVFNMAHWLDGQLKSLGVDTKLVDLGTQNVDGKEIPLPPALLGQIGDFTSEAGKKKKTILIYGHFDVQPASKSDGWDSDPFVLTTVGDKLVGRGSTDDKGPILGWLNVLQYHHDNQKELPVNLKFCFEGMEESGSEGLDDLIVKEAKGYFAGVDYVCISDNYWLNDRTPVLTYGLRGLCYFSVTVSGPAWDLHSGVFGGTVYEPMTDLVTLLSKLVDNKGKILIPGVVDRVPSVTSEEIKLYEKLDYSIADIDKAVGAPIALSSDKVEVLMGRMRNPSLSLHGIEGAFSGEGAKTVIPAKVSGKFSIRLVPDQDPKEINKLVKVYLESEFAKLNSKSKLEVKPLSDGKPWVADYKNPNYEAARVATLLVYGKEPDFTREGGSIPVTLTFSDALGVNVLLLPMGRGDDGAHSTNEKLNRSNFIEGTKLLGLYLYEIGASINIDPKY